MHVVLTHQHAGYQMWVIFVACKHNVTPVTQNKGWLCGTHELLKSKGLYSSCFYMYMVTVHVPELLAICQILIEAYFKP